jgi:hypothetical protein
LLRSARNDEGNVAGILYLNGSAICARHRRGTDLYAAIVVERAISFSQGSGGTG